MLALQVGLLDIDICGPSAPKLTGLEGEEVHQSGSGWSPVYVQDNLAVMSIGKAATPGSNGVTCMSCVAIDVTRIAHTCFPARALGSSCSIIHTGTATQPKV